MTTGTDAVLVDRAPDFQLPDLVRDEILAQSLGCGSGVNYDYLAFSSLSDQEQDVAPFLDQ